ncbi:protein kinase C-binding protein 1-like [Contarinia nasturtii]|uniref:protein kinase C-binding protein 1-like n=1 Tax=Contarinia nasturtii TaxID=265458 RepID=UPI0012D49828|nr:protein kinase C-binding protein 1-like [Contarinia nasturtii]
MSSTKVKHDLFCWHCNSDGTTIKCNNCIRSFHTACENNDGQSQAENWQCSVCDAVDASKETDKPSDVKMLSVMIKAVWNLNTFNSLKNPFKKSNRLKSIVNIIDLTKIKKNIDTYTNFAEFRNDVRWIVHNCVILFKDEDKKTKLARSLLNSITYEIDNIINCSECYLNASKFAKDWFTKVCSKTHALIWAKVEGYPYWPAKVMAVKEPMIRVDFFGDHSQAKVMARKCFLYSEESPKPSRNTTEEYVAALKETDEYIQNLRQKFGSFRFAESKTVFNPALLDDYISKMCSTTVKKSEVHKSDNQVEYDRHVDDSEIEIRASSKRKIDSVVDEPAVPTKKVRFSDEFGEVLMQVHLIDQSDDYPDSIEQDKSSSNDPQSIEYSSSDDEDTIRQRFFGFKEKSSDTMQPSDQTIDSDNELYMTASGEMPSEESVFDCVEQEMQQIHGNGTVSVINHLTSEEVECDMEMAELRVQNAQLQTALVEMKKANQQYSLENAALNKVIMQYTHDTETLKKNHAKRVAEIEMQLQKVIEEKVCLQSGDEMQKVKTARCRECNKKLDRDYCSLICKKQG